VLTLEQALKTAAERQPSLRRARAQTAAASARADQAEAPLWPQVNGTASYQRVARNGLGAGSTDTAGVVPSGGGSDVNWFNRFNFGLNATQLVYDFGRTTGRSEAADESLQAQRASEVLSEQQVQQGVRAAFFSARAAKTMLAVAQETLANVERHVAQIDAFVRAGARAEIDLLELRTDRANARVELISAENTYATAKAQLNQAIGYDVGGADGADYDVADDGMPAVAGEDGQLRPLYERAQRSRPELRVLARQLRAQQLTIDATRGGYWPSLSVGTGVTEGGTELDDMAWSWNAGATLSWPLYQGGLTVAQVDEARAQLNSLHADVDAQRQRIRLEVEQARLSVRAAKATLEASDEALVSARERLRLAEGRYAAGAGSALELSDAQLALANAQAQRVRADYTLASARASLLLALGE
jgi:outer membrane protein